MWQKTDLKFYYVAENIPQVFGHISEGRFSNMAIVEQLNGSLYRKKTSSR